MWFLREIGRWDGIQRNAFKYNNAKDERGSTSFNNARNTNIRNVVWTGLIYSCCFEEWQVVSGESIDLQTRLFY